MESHELEYVLSIAELKSFSRAAEKLYLSQPYLSRFISNLEKRLGVKLFDRSKSPLSLTLAGEIFVEYARDSVDMEREMEKRLLKASAPDAHLLYVGFTSTKGTHIQPSVLPAFIEKYPNAKIFSTVGTATELEDAVCKGVLDLAIFAQPTYAEGVCYEPINNHDRVLLVVPEGHPLYDPDCGSAVQKMPFSPQRLQEFRFILAAKNTGLRRVSEKILAEKNLKPEIVMEIYSFEVGMKVALAHGGFLTFISEISLKNRNFAGKANFFEIGSPPYALETVVAYKQINPYIRDFIDLVSDFMS